MTAPHVLPFLPGYIPPDVCGPVGQNPATTTVDTCLSLVVDDVRDDGVSAPSSPENAGLAEVVADAQQQGIDLKIVVLPTDPPLDTPLRDIATEVGLAYPGSTVLALSPSYAGVYSQQFDRVTLEAGQDIAKTGEPVQSSKNFVSQLNTPDFPWTGLTIVVVLGVAAAVAATRWLQNRGKRAARDEPAVTAPEQV